jgi:tetratricopeptide (TPR) repeat protein
MVGHVLRETAMKRRIGIALVLAGCIAALPANGQQSNSGAASSQNKQPAAQPQQQKPAPQDANPFPTDTTNVPVMPSRENPEPNVPRNAPTSTADQIEDAHYPVPGDSDPVASPDAAPAELNNQGQVSSSNTNSLDSILPPPGDDEAGKKGKKGSDALEEKPQETAAQDISVARYYLDNKNWRAALSRYQSALVLAPEDPEVYWGLAVSQQHMGDFANARANYEKVIEYDPDSKHAKEARKALKEPDLANVKPAPSIGQK